MAAHHPPVVQDLLPRVSRSFYLTLRVLPARIRPPIGLAYLLARVTDTIADTNLIPVSRRLEALEQYRDAILGKTPQPGSVLPPQAAHSEKSASEALDERHARRPCGLPPWAVEIAEHQASEAEKELLLRADEVLCALSQVDPGDRERIRNVLDVITKGQLGDVERFGAATTASPRSLTTAEELDAYTYAVAGCVGEFWTRMCRAHLFPEAFADDDPFTADGIRFGKGLQLVNILRDLATDLRLGRCYLPLEELAAVRLQPKDLLQPEAYAVVKPIYEAWCRRAWDHLQAGWRYTNALPPSQRRLRLACAWPILIGVRTLRRLEAANPLDPDQRVKVPRPEVRRIMLRSLVALLRPRLWEAQWVRAAS